MTLILHATVSVLRTKTPIKESGLNRHLHDKPTSIKLKNDVKEVEASKKLFVKAYFDVKEPY